MIANIENEKFFTKAIKNKVLEVRRDGTVLNLKTGREIGHFNSSGYKCIGMKQDKKVRHILVHRLVYTFFVEVLKPSEQINHIDGNKKNNHIDNLEKVSCKENIEHAYKLGLYDKAKKTLKNRFSGHKGNSSKLTKEDVIEIRRLFSIGNVSRNDLSKRFKIHKSNVCRILNNKSYIYN